ncbi:uncharacterized protein FA14DRAFT_114441, partial [Meira miltonrushii]
LCVTCSTQTSFQGKELNLDVEDSDHKCKICLDPRQYIGPSGQKWTTLERLINNPKEKLRNDFGEIIPDQLWTFKTRPAFGIGQRAFLMKDDETEGLIMWDCVAYLDDKTISNIDRLSNGKGISHMVISHPHYYSTTATWTRAFPQMKIWLAKVDFDDWYQRDDNKDIADRIVFIDQEQTMIGRGGQTKALLLGGHFPGSLVLLYKDNLLIADTIQVVPSGLYKSHEKQRPNVTSVTFLWSYPNQIPLSGKEVRRVCEPLEKVQFTKAFGAFENFNIWNHAKEKILQSRDII